MRIKPEQLNGHLQGQGLQRIYLISGDEPLQCIEAADAVRSFARQQGFVERQVLLVNSVFAWQKLLDTAAELSLFAPRRLLELRLQEHSPGKAGGQALFTYAAEPPEDCVLLITAGKLDRRSQQSRWYKAIDRVGVCIPVWPVASNQMQAWIIARCERLGWQIAPDAAAFMASHVAGNLLAASQELEKLFLLSNTRTLTIELVASAVIDSSRYDVFGMIDAALAGEARPMLRMLSGLQTEGVEIQAVLGAVLWEFRRVCLIATQLGGGVSIDKACVASYAFPLQAQRKRAILSVIQRHSCMTLHSLLLQALRIEKSYKGLVKGEPWHELRAFLLKLAGVPNIPQVTI